MTEKSALDLIKKIQEKYPEWLENVELPQPPTEEEIKERAKRRRQSSIANGVAATATGVAAAAALSSVLSSQFFSFLGEREQISEQQLRYDFSQMAEDLEGRITTIERALSAGIDGAALGLLQFETSNNSQRIVAIEKLLDTQPREVVEILRLRDELSDLREGFADRQLQITRELDRAYNTVLALIGALIVAVIAMVIGNFLRSSDRP